MRVGLGYDIHCLEANLPLVLGGVNIPHTHGLVGWSDADVLTHAIMDALLGAAALGDIGTHFPPGDTRFKGISSLELLRNVHGLIQDAGYTIGNIDVTVACEKPKLATYTNTMRIALAAALSCEPNDISIKATTSEKLGFVGREEGIAAWAVAMILRTHCQ